jgi:OmpA-OmpF porin, OOP family
MKKNSSTGTNWLHLIFIVLLTSCLQVQAQQTTTLSGQNVFNEYWYIGIHGGKSNYIGDLNNNKFWNNQFEWGSGLTAGHQISPVLGVRLQYVAGKLSADKENDFKKSLDSKYRELGYQVTLNINDLFGKYNSNRLLNIFAFAGPSIISYHSIVKNENELPYMETKGRYNELLFIIGGGVSLKLLKPVHLNIEYAHHLSTIDDRMDFVDAKSKKDKIGYESIGLTYRFLGKDKDKDGILDKADVCPDIPGKVELAGCPDKDNDGIADKDDACPDVAGKSEFRGCPDTDNDGVADNEDLCPALAGLKELKGCPDKDSDGIADKDDKCPDLAGIKELAGCPDKDNDGIADIDDLCPNEKGLKDFNGCPDKDGDGTPDKDDKCPDIAGPYSNAGCPETKTSELYKVLYFDPGRTAVISKYMKDIKEIEDLLKKQPEVNLLVEGYADAIGEDNYNMMLSDKRADYVIHSLQTRQIDKKRLSKKSYGETKPAGDNTTPTGRQLNRRVEIKTMK